MATAVGPTGLCYLVAFSSTVMIPQKAIAPDPVGQTNVLFSAIAFVPEGPAIMASFGGSGGSGTQGYINCS